MGRIFTYSFEDCTVTFDCPNYGTYSAYGSGLGEFTIALSNDAVSHQVSADLSIVISKHVIKNGTIQFNIPQASDFNNWLRGWANYLESPDTPITDFAATNITISNRSTGDVYYLTGCTHQKVSDQAFGSDAQNRTWTIMAANIANTTI